MLGMPIVLYLCPHPTPRNLSTQRMLTGLLGDLMALVLPVSIQEAPTLLPCRISPYPGFRVAFYRRIIELMVNLSNVSKSCVLGILQRMSPKQGGFGPFCVSL